MLKSRSYTASIMSNAGFSSLTVVQGGVLFTIPQKCINKLGNVRGNLLKLIKNCSSLQDVNKLHTYGIDTTIA